MLEENWSKSCFFICLLAGLWKCDFDQNGKSENGRKWLKFRNLHRPNFLGFLAANLMKEELNKFKKIFSSTSEIDLTEILQQFYKKFQTNVLIFKKNPLNCTLYLKFPSIYKDNLPTIFLLLKDNHVDLIENLTKFQKFIQKQICFYCDALLNLKTNHVCKLRYSTLCKSCRRHSPGESTLITYYNKFNLCIYTGPNQKCEDCQICPKNEKCQTLHKKICSQYFECPKCQLSLSLEKSLNEKSLVIAEHGDCKGDRTQGNKRCKFCKKYAGKFHGCLLSPIKAPLEYINLAFLLIYSSKNLTNDLEEVPVLGLAYFEKKPGFFLRKTWSIFPNFEISEKKIQKEYWEIPHKMSRKLPFTRFKKRAKLTNSIFPPQNEILPSIVTFILQSDDFINTVVLTDDDSLNLILLGFLKLQIEPEIIVNNGRFVKLSIKERGLIFRNYDLFLKKPIKKLNSEMNLGINQSFFPHKYSINSLFKPKFEDYLEIQDNNEIIREKKAFFEGIVWQNFDLRVHLLDFLDKEVNVLMFACLKFISYFWKLQEKMVEYFGKKNKNQLFLHPFDFSNDSISSLSFNLYRCYGLQEKFDLRSLPSDKGIPSHRTSKFEAEYTGSFISH